MGEKGLAVVTDETIDEYQRIPGSGKFALGNKGGPGGSRPGSGRKPQPADETLLKRLYDLLDGNADKALEVIVSQLQHNDPKIAQKAALAVLAKVLPEGRLLKTWKDDSGNKAEEVKEFKEFMMWKVQNDLSKCAEDAELLEEEGEGAEHGN